MSSRLSHAFRQLLGGRPWQRKKLIGRTSSRPRRLQLETLESRLAPTVFNVNSLADILNPAAGTVTLRSAIKAANATPGDNTINLNVPGTYRITLAGSGEDNNAAGDFDILGKAGGGNLTIQNTSGGKVVVDGNHLDRVFDINPTPLFTANLNGTQQADCV